MVVSFDRHINTLFSLSFIFLSGITLIDRCLSQVSSDNIISISFIIQLLK